MSSNPFKTCYEEFIYKRTYARYIHDEHRRENWDETVKRYGDFFRDKVNAISIDDDVALIFAKSEYEKAIQDIEKLKIVPSMRALWTAGEALKRDNIAGYNCFSPDTAFYTSKGIKRFSECKDGENVYVLNSNASYVPATVKMFGKEKVYTITFKKSGHTYSVKATGNHRWITTDERHSQRNVITTLDLKEGMIIPSVASKKLPYLCETGIEHGIVFGDGSKTQPRTMVSYSPSHIMLCGDSVSLKKYFRKEAKYITDNKASIMGLPYNYKTLPDIEANVQYLAGFLSGWFAADGYFNGKQGTLACKNKDSLKWAQVAFSKIGIRTYEIREDYRQNSFSDEEDIRPIFYLSLELSTVPYDFFLHEKHQAKYNLSENKKFFNWRVVSIEDFNESTDVWCVQEPKSETFTLANGMLTKNCAALIIDKPKAFADLLYILMNGAGAGISVERQYVTKLPEIPEHFTKKKCEPIVFEDSKLGWAQGFYEYITKLYEGVVCEYDLSLLRPKGAILKTFGGRASGPAPLEELLKFVTNTFMNARGRKLNSLECHDICCYVAKVIVVGGVRRSAILSLSNRSDDRIAHAKDGEFWNINPQRMLANNSIAYTEKPSIAMFFDDWMNLMRSNSGERGIFNRESADFIVSQIGRRETGKDWLCNPCSEIILRPQEFCNLTEVIVRPEDTKETLCEKVRSATIIGCLQSTLTKFNFLGREWKKNCEEERLLGVSLTGLMDHPTLNKVSKDAKVWLTEMKQTAIETAREWSQLLGINMPVAITCTKPSGTVSQLVNCASGIHPRQYQYYIRRVRVAKMDPIAGFLIDAGVPYNPEVGETLEDCNNYVFDFPQKAPEFAVTADEVTAIEQLNYWLMIQKHWCEHKPSVTIYVGENEWLEVGAWVFKNWKWVSGISFLPRNGGVYQLAPYEEIDKEKFEELSEKMPDIDFTKLAAYEKVDSTEGSKSYACGAGGCEI